MRLFEEEGLSEAGAFPIALAVSVAVEVAVAVVVNDSVAVAVDIAVDVTDSVAVAVLTLFSVTVIIVGLRLSGNSLIKNVAVCVATSVLV